MIKLFEQFKDKYRSLGRVGGTVNLGIFNDKEIEAFASFLGESKDLLLEKQKIPLLAFEKALTNSIFHEYTFVELLEDVLKEKIITKSEETEIELKQEQQLFNELYSLCSEGQWWWDYINSNRTESRWILSRYKEDPNRSREELLLVFEAFETLYVSKKFERLPLFAQRITGNPHYFDGNEFTGKLLIHCMYVDQNRKGLSLVGLPKTNEETNDLLSYYKLMKDDLWSFVTCRGLLAENENGQVHPVWKAAVECDSVLNMPIKELLKVQKIYPAKGDKVWIVENSSVCSTLVDEISDMPIICTHGQFRTASWVILDQLIQSDCCLFYSGDLDPEGLLMAQRLKERYKSQLHFWRMDNESYLKVKSEEDISTRLMKLNLIHSPELLEVVKSLNEYGTAGYQEGLITDLIEDIQKVRNFIAENH